MAIATIVRTPVNDPLDEGYFTRAAHALDIHRADATHSCTACGTSLALCESSCGRVHARDPHDQPRLAATSVRMALRIPRAIHLVEHQLVRVGCTTATEHGES